MTDVFQEFAKDYAAYGYPVLFVGVLLENAGIPVPGETAVLVAGFLSSSAGGGHFSIGWVIVLTVIAAVLGDNCGYLLGHYGARPRLQKGKGFLFLTPKTLLLAEGYFARYGLWTIFFARFITGLRVIGALAAGTAGMPWTRFLVANTAGAITWASTMCLLGYFFGHSWELLHRWLGRGGLIILGSVVILVALPYLLRRLHHMPFGKLEWARAQVWQGVLAAVLEVVCIGVLVLLAQGKHVTPLDRRVVSWIGEHDVSPLNTLAVLGSLLGGLPACCAVTVVVLTFLWRRGRPWDERMVLLWALFASEAIGLLLVGLLRARSITPNVAIAWPRGFSGSVPLRAFALFGMVAYLLPRQFPRWEWVIKPLAAALVLWTGFSVVWNREQMLSETLLEFAAGAIVLFAGLWWLEGFGPGVIGPESSSKLANVPTSSGGSSGT